MLLSLLAGCDNATNYRDLYLDAEVSDPDNRILISDFARQLNLKVVSQDHVVIKLADSRNSVLIFTGENGEIMVNGRTIFHRGAILDGKGDYRISVDAVNEVRASLRRKYIPNKNSEAEKERLRKKREAQQRKIREEQRKRREAEARNKKLKTSPLIIIDPGHGGRDSGAIRRFANRNDRRRRYPSNQEKTIVLNVAKQVAKRLRSAGARVVLTRSTDNFIDLDRRVAIANNKKPKLFVSIHADAAMTRRAKGHTVYYPQRLSSTGRSYKVGKAIDKNLKAITNSKRKIRQHSRKLRVLENTRCSALLIELGFLSNPTESSKLVTASYQNKLAKAIADGIISQIEK